MQLHKLKKQYELLGTEIASLEQDSNQQFPKKGDKYLTFTAEGDICAFTTSHNKSRVLTYKTRKDAKHAMKIELAKSNLKQAIKTLNGDLVPDWDNQNTKKWTVTGFGSGQSLSCQSTYRRNAAPRWMYLETIDHCAALIKSNTEDLLLVLYGQ